MSGRRIATAAQERAWLPRRVVVVAIDDETVQAMICVALEHDGFQPLAVGLGEAILLITSLPSSPIALIVASADGDANPLRRLTGLSRGKRSSLPPTLLVERPEPMPDEPARHVAPPDLAAILQTVGSLALA